MILKEQKKKILSLIEEYNSESEYLTDDPDIQSKINSVINQIQMELMVYKKIPAKTTITIPDNKIVEISEIPSCYQIYMIPNVKYEIYLNDIIFDSEETGEVIVYYYKLPNLIPENIELLEEETEEQAIKRIDETYTFEISDVLLEIMPYGVAADLLKNDMISGYGRYYYERYNELKQTIDSRDSVANITVEGGLDI